MSRILFLSRWFPYPASNGSKLRIYNLLRGLAAHHQISLISFNDQPDQPVDRSGLEPICQTIEVVPWQAYNPNGRRAKFAFFNPQPRFLIDTYSPEMAAAIDTAVANGRFDLIIASQIDMAAYAPHFGTLPALFEEAEIATLYEQYHQAGHWREKARYGLTWAKHRRYLSHLLPRFAACTVVSGREKQLLQTAVAAKLPIEIIPNCLNLADYADVQPTAVANQLVFTGAFTYQPNYQAMCWFVAHVLPLIRQQIPDVQLTITGNHANLPLPSSEGVTLTGFVDDVRPYIARAMVSLVPIWTGGGTRLKILEAMALGTAVVATSKGAEGLDGTAGEHLLVADTAVAYASATVRLLQDADLRQKLERNGRRLVEQHYHWPVVEPRFLKLLQQILQNSHRRL